MFSILFLLLLGHLFADYYLQTTRIGAYKRKNLAGLAVHALTWTLVVSVILVMAGLFSPWKFYFLFLTHFFIDLAKIRLFQPRLGKFHPVNVMDQFLHLSTILATVFYT